MPSLPLSRKTPIDTVQNKEIINTEKPTVFPNKAYHIIIASLPTQKSADEYIRSFNNKGDFDKIQTITGNGRYRISAAHFYDKKEAELFVKNLRIENKNFDDAWVLLVKQI